MRSLAWGLVGMACAHPSLAQTPPDAGLLLKQQEQLQKKLPDRRPQPEASEIGAAALDDDGGIKVRVQSVQFKGARDIVPEARLQSLVGDVIGKELDFAGLQELATRVTDYLRNKGHLLARAYLAPHDVTDGHIEITVQNGRLDGSPGMGGGWRINTAPGSRMSPATLKNFAESAAASGSSIMQADLERALLLINDLPGVSAHASVGPGIENGTSIVTIEAGQGPLLGGRVWADNYGNLSTGQAQANAQANINDLSGRGDHAGLLLTESAGLQLGRMGYDLPLGHDGLRGAMNYLDMRYRVINGFGEPNKLTGTSQIVDLGATYPFIRSRAQNLAGGFSIARKHIVDNSAAGPLNDKLIDVLGLQMSGTTQPDSRGDRYLSGGIALNVGRLDLGALPASQVADASSWRTQGDYLKANYQLSGLQKLGSKVTLTGRFSGQVASRNLDSSEKFILGGPNGVRAYPAAEAPGDEGWLASLEMHYDMPGLSTWGELSLFSFVDLGGISLHKNPGTSPILTATGRNRFNLAGAGLGLTLMRTENYSVNLLWAQPLGSNPGRSLSGMNADNRRDTSRFWLQASVGF